MIGQTISHYKILEKLGEGGMGVVYKAEDLKLQRSVALKFLPPELTRDPEAKERFIHEARAASALDHNNICTVHEIDETADGRAFIAMACIDGETLRNKIEAGPLKLDRAIDITLQVAEGLQEAHEKGIVHRDIKPANIMMTKKGQAKITDFGLAKLAGKTRLTKSGTTVGTAAYMSPEQARGGDVDNRTDIWSLGVVLYEMITGRPPFKGDHEQAIVYSIVNEAQDPVTSLRTGVPLELERVVDKCMEKDPADRYQTSADLITDLRRLRRTLSDKSARSRAAIVSRTGGRRARRWLWAAAAVAIIAVAVVVGSRYVGPPGEQPISGRKMLVVLPFENLGSPEDEYFANGITDAITAGLAGLNGLGVISRQSAVQYKQSDKRVQDIGNELGVEYILEGTVQRERPGDPTSRVRIIPQLIRVSDDTHVWAETYDEEMTEVFRVQSSVAEQVASELEVTLLQSERRSLEAKPTDNLEAYEYYLRGNEYSDRRDREEDVRAATNMYEKAVELDPEFAAAWAALARNYVWPYWAWGDIGALSNAKAACDKAVQLGPELPETQLALGYLYYYAERDFEKALEHFVEAQKRRPSEPEAAAAVGLILRRQGKWEEALEQFRNAVDLDPRSFFLHEEALGWTYGSLRRYTEAERHFDRAMSLSPDMIDSYTAKAYLCLMRDGDVEQAGRILQEAVRRAGLDGKTAVKQFPNISIRILSEPLAELIDPLSLDTSGATSALDSAEFWLAKAELAVIAGRKEMAAAYYDSASVLLKPAIHEMRASPLLPFVRSYLGLAYAGLGRKEEAIREGEMAVELLPISKDAVSGTEPVEMLAEIYTKVGELDAAIDQLEMLLSIPSFVSVPLLRIDPVWDPLRDHPRFQQLLVKYSGESS